MKRKGISIVLCCYNSEKRLQETLQHLAEQETSNNLDWEIIVVDNNSSDNTANVAYKVWTSFSTMVPFKVITERTPGLSAAREKGLEAAAFSYILFCDDDNWLDKTYVQIAFEIMESNHLIGVIGGLGEPAFENEPPNWFHLVGGQYATGIQSDQVGDLSNSKGYVFGAGMVIRLEAYQILRQAGFKSILTDRVGKELSSGGDNELCYALILAGYKVWYDDRLRFKHYLPAGRLTWDYLKRLNLAFAVTAYHLRAYQYFFDPSSKPKSNIWVRDMAHLISYIPKFIKRLMRKENSLDEHKMSRIALSAHLHLIKTYLKKRDDLDRNIIKIKQLINNLRNVVLIQKETNEPKVKTIDELGS